MKKLIIYLSVLLSFLFVGLSPVYAGFEEGFNAYHYNDDFETAFQEFKPLAEQGYADAQFYLGQMYSMGNGIPKDKAEAFKWFRKSAEQGNAQGQYNLGMMYYKAKGVPRDYVMAYMWLTLSGKTGFWKRKVVEKKMTPEQIAEAQRLSREFIVK